MPVQHQPNNVDCGVFAVAFGTDIFMNIKPDCNLQNGCDANSTERKFNTKQIQTISQNYKKFK